MPKKKKYRFDDRTEKEFRKDIKDRTLQERSLFLLWLDLIESKTGKRPTYQDTGCGKTGEFLEDKDVSTAPDFEVDGYGKLEVKFSKPMLDRVFHLKAGQVKSYKESGATILMVNGADSETPKFTLLTTEALASVVEDCRVVSWAGFGGKMSYRIPVDKFIWRDLK
jgi:hypothetical protein